MKYTDKEKQIAKNFIDCKIPECIRNNDFNLVYDSMEYYEALFDFAYCILNESELTSVFSTAIMDESFTLLMKSIKEHHNELNFYEKANSLFSIVSKHIK